MVMNSQRDGANELPEETIVKDIAYVAVAAYMLFAAGSYVVEMIRYFGITSAFAG